MELLLKNATIVNALDNIKSDLYIKDGKVKAIGIDLKVGHLVETIDCRDKFILPGFVDMHFHCRVPGNTDREDFDTATMAASRGGITTLVEMPIAKPSPCNKERFNNRVNYAKDRAVIDFGFYGAGANINEQRAIELAECGALGFKIFLHNKPKGREDEFENLCVTNTGDLYKSLYNNGKTGLLTAVHCEDDGLLRGVRDLYTKDRMSYQSQHDCRIAEAEALAVLTTGIVAKAANGKVHICHVTSADAVDAIKFLVEQGVNISAETCPPYMLMDEDDLRQYGAQAKINPTVKGKRHKDSLIKALKDNVISAVASDHAPFLPQEKENKNMEFLDLPSGMPSAEVFGPIMINEVINGRWTFNQLVQWMCQNPAKLLGIYPNKGSLNIGADADFIIVDTNTKTGVDIDKLFTKSKESLYPFAFKEYRGKIISTYVRGTKVYNDDTIFVEPGFGKFVSGPKYKG